MYFYESYFIELSGEKLGKIFKVHVRHNMPKLPNASKVLKEAMIWGYLRLNLISSQDKS